MKLIGIGGLPRSGKDTLAEMYMEHGYFGMSFGDIIRSYSRERHKDKPDPISVANMTNTSNWLREKEGADVILKEAIRQYQEASKTKSYKGLVLFSVRTPVEVDFILAHGGELIWVEASDEIRLSRANENLREGELPLTLEKMKQHEALQWEPQPGVPVEAQMNTSYVKEKATKTLFNDGNDVATFKENAEQALGFSPDERH